MNETTFHTGRWPRIGTICLLLAIVSAGCGEDNALGNATETPPIIQCSPSADDVFLKSKADGDTDDDIADHAWVRDEAGVYHLFFQNEGVLAGGSDIEHYTSTDLKSLQYVGLALIKAGSWESHGLWAPYVVRSGATYWMFYTGTEGLGPDSKQRIGVATSTDLTNWTRFPINNCPGTSGDGCIYECDESWTTWRDTTAAYNAQCRDPFVIRDTDNQRWVMYATAKSTNEFGTVTVSYSSDLINWTGAGYINATRRLQDGTRGQTTGGQAENPFIMSHDGTYYLLFSDWQDPEDNFAEPEPRTMVQYATSASLNADTLGSAHWTYRGYTPDPGVNAIEVQRIGGDTWLMSQSVSNRWSGASTHIRELRLRCVAWEGPYGFDTWHVE